jgi:nucleoside 2-deoxyribosyltransferase
MSPPLSARTVYILGPMTGYPDDNRQAFRSAAKTLRAAGFRVISPDELDQTDPPRDSSWSGNLTRDIPWVVQADMGVALPGWRSSRGATLEATILNALGKPVMALGPGGALTPVPTESLPVPSHPSTG